MTLTEFLSGNTITSDAITSWTDRKGADPDHVTARLGFLRKHLAKHVKTNPIPENTLITVARRKVEAFGLGEILTTADGNTFAAAAGQFRVLTASEAAPIPETPIAEAAAPAKPKAKRDAKGRFIKAEEKQQKTDNFRGIIDYSPAEVDEAIASVLGSDF